ncbi:MAG: class I SAM-dependent methyltransferase [Gammaproteobacteria bacterium]|nr:class I SAM-dependent methyltransferase [Gammaproteobacteria bacterium]MBQ0839033.1 class I SAM-dependent methyltransferase [Gammaproteobacteria bacterium]
MQRIIQSIHQGAKAGVDACRLCHGRGHGLPGLEFVSVDWFSPVLLISLYKQPAAEWLEQLRSEIGVFNKQPNIKNIILQHRYLSGAPSENLKGDIQGDYYAEEKGLKFHLNFKANQNIGFFLDMANCRQVLREHVEGKSVLNLFAYTCAFSVVATEAGATKVVNVDMAKGALNTGRRNHQLNNIDTRPVSFLGHDIFKSWGKIRKYGPYDRVIIDPPSFQAGSFNARKDYQKIVRKLPGLLSARAQVIACLNSPDLDFAFLRALFSEAGGFVEKQVISTPPSFPEADADKGLKTLIFEASR